MPNDKNDQRLEKMPNPQQSPEKTGDGIAMVVVALLLIAIIANSPNKNTKNKDVVTDTITTVDSTKQKTHPDTTQIEHYTNTFDSMFFETFYPKHR